jgi:hypothetical protein
MISGVASDGALQLRHGTRTEERRRWSSRALVLHTLQGPLRMPVHVLHWFSLIGCSMSRVRSRRQHRMLISL